jgi:hypothetical protein
VWKYAAFWNVRVTIIGELGTTLAVTSNRRTLRRNTNIFLRSVRRLLVTANVVPSSPILVTLMMEALSSSETSVLIRATWRNIPEDGILHSYRSENLKSYLNLCSFSIFVFIKATNLLNYFCEDPGRYRIISIKCTLLTLHNTIVYKTCGFAIQQHFMNK